MFAFYNQMAKRLYFILLGFIIIAAGCSKYQKTLKNPDMNKKLELAIYYYNKKDYYRASSLFEQLQDNYSGTAMAQKIIYYSAYCNYGLKAYALAGFQFKAYFENFPTGEWAEESLYMFAYSQFLESQPSYLDQTDTFKALDGINLFVSIYPDSKYIPECNTMIDKLRVKLASKAIRMAKLYYSMGEYKSAIVALQNVVKDYPEISQKEELEFYVVKSHYLLASNSVETKKVERYKNTQNVYAEFIIEYPDSKYLNELRSMNEKCRRAIIKIEEREKTKQLTTTNN
jgi:outer membrane protein assembly factor BamD